MVFQVGEAPLQKTVSLSHHSSFAISGWAVPLSTHGFLLRKRIIPAVGLFFPNSRDILDFRSGQSEPMHIRNDGF